MIRTIHRVGGVPKFVIENFTELAFIEAERLSALVALQGKKLRITVEECVEIEFNARVVGYWFGEIVPKVRAGLRGIGEAFNDDDTTRFIHHNLRTITKQETSYLLLDRFVSSIIVDTRNGRIEKVIPVLGSMNPEQVSHLFDPIIAWAAEHLNVQINQPNETVNG